ncbi:hypothetical protein NW739_05500 [Mycoplasmopsis felis]|uniref:hypothetical protein n=1 Tax=Mycoplasmopsis felis TaxID=33923 RepID=UPI0021E0AC1E|nr:hypothetical protein [Mycoplasmopsis felis]MCU9940123.1 hypothetical protein [Mycoplasmopsis felis]
MCVIVEIPIRRPNDIKIKIFFWTSISIIDLLLDKSSEFNKSMIFWINVGVYVLKKISNILNKSVIINKILQNIGKFK